MIACLDGRERKPPWFPNESELSSSIIACVIKVCNLNIE